MQRRSLLFVCIVALMGTMTLVAAAATNCAPAKTPPITCANGPMASRVAPCCEKMHAQPTPPVLPCCQISATEPVSWIVLKIDQPTTPMLPLTAALAALTTQDTGRATWTNIVRTTQPWRLNPEQNLGCRAPPC